MLTVTKKSEILFLQELKRCLDHEPSQRCLFIRFSDVEYEAEDWFDVFLQEWRLYFGSEPSQIYLLQDDDVFVLMRTLTQKRVNEFITHLTTKLAPAPLSPGLASLFEVRFDWPKLKTICHKKIDAAQKVSRETTTKDVTTEAVDVCEYLSPDLVTSIKERRAARKEAYVMVVEDDPFSQKLVRNALKNNYDHSISGDGSGALMGYIKNAPDILFLDIGLPDIDGHEVLKRLFEFDPDAFVVMFSGNGNRENVMKAIELGAKGFVGKPFTQEKLFQYIGKSPFIQHKFQGKEHSHADTLH